jgi:hypothetical protein
MTVLSYHLTSRLLWTPGRVAADFAKANGDPNKIPKILYQFTGYFEIVLKMQ